MLVIDFVLDISQIVLADIVLSGDNALIIGMAAASFAEKDRKKIIFFGLLAAALLRILFALLASYLITIPGLLLVGALLLYWVCFKFYQDIKEFSKSDEENKEDVTEKVKGKSMKNALITITIADISALVCFDFAKWPKIEIPSDCINLLNYYERLNSRPSAKA